MDLNEMLNRAPLERDMAFSSEEYNGRVRRVQEQMRADGIDILVISSTPNLGYLSGYDTTMPCGYTVGILPVDGDISLHCSELESPCALLCSTIEQTYVYRWHEGQDTATQLGQILIDLGAAHKHIGVEMGNAETFSNVAFDTESYLRLKELMPEAKLVNASKLVLSVRKIKSQAELAYMRTAGEYTAIGLDASLRALEEGRTENEVVAAGYAAMIAAGSELMSIDPMIMTGKRTGYMPHIAYRRTPIHRGDPVYLEYSGCHYRYNAPSMRSGVVGPPSDGLRRLSDAALKVVDLLLENIRPGRTGHEVAEIAAQGLKDAPEDTYFHGAFGYSIGMGFQPTWTEAPMYIAENCHEELQPGMTFHMPICVWVPTEKYGIGFSESVAVTGDGCTQLTPVRERQLVVR
ncbi:MAG: Xaa-Pro peptidase family protein [Gammaproteobacteria bacterium]|nr:Xaa-Pro peptidase family protein [Gammaproteobacteria bacterium]